MAESEQVIHKLRNLGPASEKMLAKAGIFNRGDLERFGAVRAYYAAEKAGARPSLNLLYALYGALEDEHWADIDQETKTRLFHELDGYRDLDKMGRNK